MCLVQELGQAAKTGDSTAAKLLCDVLIDAGHEELALCLFYCINHGVDDTCWVTSACALSGLDWINTYKYKEVLSVHQSSKDF